METEIGNDLHMKAATQTLGQIVIAEVLSVYNAYDTLANRLENNTHGHNNGTVKVRCPRLQQWYTNNIKTEIVEAR